MNPATILVVDDSATKRYLLVSWLTRAGFTVLEAETGGQALRMDPIKLHTYDLESSWIQPTIDEVIASSGLGTATYLQSLAGSNPWIIDLDDPPSFPGSGPLCVIACDGAKSSLRRMVGAEFAGHVFEDQFLIADVRMTAAFPTERWFWFDPPFHAGRSALLHKQPDDIWRIDLQLNRFADPNVEKLPENVRQELQITLAERIEEALEATLPGLVRPAAAMSS